MTARADYGPIGRKRRSQIVAATLEVLQDRGLEGLTHRRVAAAAGVPLGAANYYFGSKESLLAAALEESMRADLEAMREQCESLTSDNVAEVVAGSLHQKTVHHRQATIIGFELLAAALRREEVREMALAWDKAWFEVLVPHVGRVAALAVLATGTGLLQRALLEGNPPSLEETTAIIRQVLR